MTPIKLAFQSFELAGEIFENQVARAFLRLLPLQIKLTSYGEELYGPVGADLGSERPRPLISNGGLAYTNRGNYFCIFFGQCPAWPVEYIGRITSPGFLELLKQREVDYVEITAAT